MKAVPARVIAVLALLACINAGSEAQATAESIWRFGFGTPDSATRAGFTKVTVKDACTTGKGHGFESTQGLLACLKSDSQLATEDGASRTMSDRFCPRDFQR